MAKTFKQGDQSFFRSSDVQVFPCAYRGKQNGTVIDPESRLNTEANFTSKFNNGYLKTYIVDWQNTTLKVVLNGYNFNIEITEEELKADRHEQNLYLKIKLVNTTVDGKPTKVLGGLHQSASDAPAELDVALSSQDSTLYFTGLSVISKVDESLGANIIILPLLTNGTLALGSKAPSMTSGAGQDSIVIGLDPNKVTSTEKNNVTGVKSVAIAGNTISGNNSMVIGTDNTIKSENSFAAGNLNNLTGNNSIVAGNDNTVTSESSLSVGGHNEVSGTGSVAFGIHNTVSAPYSIAAGGKNTVTAGQAMAIGASNSILDGGNCSIAVGSNNKVSTTASAVFGKNLETCADDQVVIGDNNDTNAKINFVSSSITNDGRTAKIPLIIASKGNTGLPSEQVKNTALAVEVDTENFLHLYPYKKSAFGKVSLWANYNGHSDDDQEINDYIIPRLSYSMTEYDNKEAKWSWVSKSAEPVLNYCYNAPKYKTINLNRTNTALYHFEPCKNTILAGDHLIAAANEGFLNNTFVCGTYNEELNSHIATFGKNNFYRFIIGNGRPNNIGWSDIRENALTIDRLNNHYINGNILFASPRDTFNVSHDKLDIKEIALKISFNDHIYERVSSVDNEEEFGNSIIYAVEESGSSEIMKLYRYNDITSIDTILDRDHIYISSELAETISNSTTIAYTLSSLNLDQDWYDYPEKPIKVKRTEGLSGQYKVILKNKPTTLNAYQLSTSKVSIATDSRSNSIHGYTWAFFEKDQKSYSISGNINGVAKYANNLGGQKLNFATLGQKHKDWKYWQTNSALTPEDEGLYLVFLEDSPYNTGAICNFGIQLIKCTDWNGAYSWTTSNIGVLEQRIQNGTTQEYYWAVSMIDDYYRVQIMTRVNKNGSISEWTESHSARLIVHKLTDNLK